MGLLPLEVTLLDLLSGTILWCVVVAVVVWGWGWFPTRDLAAKDAAAAAALNPFCRASAAAVAAACGLSLWLAEPRSTEGETNRLVVAAAVAAGLISRKQARSLIGRSYRLCFVSTTTSKYTSYTIALPCTKACTPA